MPDRFPVTAGHLLILPVRHTVDRFSLTGEERRDAEALLLLLRDKLRAEDTTITGCNIGINCGVVEIVTRVRAC